MRPWERARPCHRRNEHIAISDCSLRVGRHRFVGRIGGCNLPDGAGVDWRDAGLRRLARLLSCARQFVCAARRNTDGSLRHTRLFRRVQLCDIRRFRIRARASISHANRRNDVPRHALAAVCASVRPARVLPLLFILGRARLRALRHSRSCSFFAPKAVN